MSKIERYQGNVQAFASEAQGVERTVFGEMTQANDLTSQITAAFLRGWGIVGPSEHPSLEDFNAAMYALSQFIAYQHQAGVPEWHEEQEYYAGSVCSHGGVSYQSLEDSNTGNEPPSAKWAPFLTSFNLDATLKALAALTGSADKLAYFNGPDTAALTALTGVGRDIIGKTTIADVLSYLGLKEAAKRDVGTGTSQIPDMSSFTYSTSGSAAFVIKLPGGIVIQGDNFTTDSNGYQLITMGLALSDYQVLVCEGQSGGWTASGGIYSFLTAYGANKISSSQFSVRSASWRSSDKNFIAQSTVGTWIAIGRI